MFYKILPPPPLPEASYIPTVSNKLKGTQQQNCMYKYP